MSKNNEKDNKEQLSSSVTNSAESLSSETPSGYSQAHQTLMGNNVQGSTPVERTGTVANQELPSTLGSFIRGGISNGVNKVVGLAKAFAGMLTAGMSALAGALGMSTRMLSIVGSTTGTMTLILIVSLAIGYFNSNKMIIDDYDVDCSQVQEEAAMNDLSDMEFDKVAEAKLIYSALSDPRIGYKPAFIAGMLSNAEAESTLRPNCYEGDYLSSASWQKYAFSDWNKYCTDGLFPMYARSGVSIDQSAYLMDRGDGKKIYHPGLGLWQWTGPRCAKLIQFANKIDPYMDDDHDGENDRLYDTDVQLAYLLRENRSNVNEKARGWTGSATEAADWFYVNWEGGSKSWESSYKKHIKTAEEWYTLITKSPDWATDTAYAGSIIQMAAINLEDGRLTGIEAAYEGTLCKPKEDSTGFDSAAQAAVSWAWPKGHEDYYDLHYNTTNGSGYYMIHRCTSRYVVATNVIMQNTYFHAYSACDMGVAQAVRASGIDDDYPYSTCSVIRGQLLNDPDWEYVGQLGNGKDAGDLRPGDVIVYANSPHGHTQIVVSREMCATKWPDIDTFSDSKSNWDATDYLNAGQTPPSDCKIYTVHSSYSTHDANSRGPRADQHGSHSLDNPSGTHYYIFRCKNPGTPESSSTYQRIMSVDWSQYHDGSTATTLSTKSYNYWRNLDPTSN